MNLPLPPHLQQRYPGGTVGPTADFLLPQPLVPFHSLHTYRGEIMQAAQRRDLTRLKLLVSTIIHHHENTNVDQLNACLVLHHVLWTGDLNDVAEFLIALGCDPYYPDINGDTAFHYTMRGCNLRFLRLFYSTNGPRALQVLNNNHFNLFLTAAAEAPADKAYEILNVLEWLYLSGCSIESQDVHGKTALTWACQRGSITLVQWLLSRGASLAHRDHVGRTILQAACVSSDEDVVRLVCEKGAIGLLECTSNDDHSTNTAIKLCWNRGHFFLGLLLQQWYFQRRFCGRMSLFKNAYAWYYWVLVGSNFIVYLMMAGSLVSRNYDTWYYCSMFLVLYTVTQFFWLMAYAADPGRVKQNVIPDQSNRCSTSLRHDLAQRPPFAYRVTSACFKLQLLERENARLSGELTALNRHFASGLYNSGARLAPDLERKFEQCVTRSQQLREEMTALMEQVGVERRAACPPGYVKQVMEGNPRRICLTCRIVKPFRAHHCGECTHCVHRFDHHCVWVDNCIGEGNQRSFVAFLLCLTLAILYMWYLVGLYYHSEIMAHSDASLDLLAQPLFYLVLVNSLFNLLWAGFVGYLLGRTVKSISTNMTFYEYLKKPSHIQKRFHGRMNGLFWDLSDVTAAKVCRNIYSFFALSNAWDEEDYGSAPITANEALLQSSGPGSVEFSPIFQQHGLGASSAPYNSSSKPPHSGKIGPLGQVPPPLAKYSTSPTGSGNILVAPSPSKLELRSTISQHASARQNASPVAAGYVVAP